MRFYEKHDQSVTDFGTGEMLATGGILVKLAP